VCNRFCQNP